MKYYCNKCQSDLGESDTPITKCPNCGQKFTDYVGMDHCDSLK